MTVTVIINLPPPPPPPDPIGGVKGQIFKFPNNSVSCQYFFMEISHADRGTINMKHIKRDFRSKACVLTLWVNLVVGVKRSKFNFSEHGHVAYQIKENRECSNIVANILPADPPYPDPGDVVNRSKSNFFRTWSCCVSK